MQKESKENTITLQTATRLRARLERGNKDRASKDQGTPALGASGETAGGYAEYYVNGALVTGIVGLIDTPYERADTKF